MSSIFLSTLSKPLSTEPTDAAKYLTAYAAIKAKNPPLKTLYDSVSSKNPNITVIAIATITPGVAYPKNESLYKNSPLFGGYSFLKYETK